MKNKNFTSKEMMVVSASRFLKDDDIVFIGIGLPSLAANLAKRVQAPNISMIYESGTLDTKPERLPLSIGDDELSKKALAVISVPEVFNYYLQGGKIEIGFLGAAQVDKFGNINTTIIGKDYKNPKVRLPGAGGAPEIAAFCKDTLIMLRQTKRNFVNKLDFITSVGYADGNNSRDKLNFVSNGPKAIITDLGILEPCKVTQEFILTHIHEGVSIQEVKDATGWPLKISENIITTSSPSLKELEILRKLEATQN
ncbi:CoA-transferase subunit beta [Polaribacter tangerinus]|uniref:CoA-transferase subunit beta n=1 Tax=Polaribacter tangerinus TaxID=1920034 RepID=UPI000B4BAF0D|nr:CoA-transferase subunit beta [Polaribacter tangerinus]